jgi:hypothetical protein
MDRIRASPSVARQLGSVVRTKKIDAEDPLHLYGIGFVAFDISLSRYSGAIYQNVDLWKLAKYLNYFVPICYITNYRDKLFSQNALHLLQLVLVDIDSSYARVEVYEACADSATQS